MSLPVLLPMETFYVDRHTVPFLRGLVEIALTNCNSTAVSQWFFSFLYFFHFLHFKLSFNRSSVIIDTILGPKCEENRMNLRLSFTNGQPYFI